MVAAVVCTLVFLVFAEVTPKNFAQYRPETLAFPSSYVLQPLLKIAQPLVALVNSVRDVNRMLAWELPTSGPRTLNGLVLEHLEFIPDVDVCLRIDRYLIETRQLSDNVVRTVQVNASVETP